jgi:hypothetical protein
MFDKCVHFSLFCFQGVWLNMTCKASMQWRNVCIVKKTQLFLDHMTDLAALSPCGNFCVTCSNWTFSEKLLYVLRLAAEEGSETGHKIVYVLKGHVHGVVDVAWSHDGRWISSFGMFDECVMLWDVRNKAQEADSDDAHVCTLAPLRLPSSEIFPDLSILSMINIQLCWSPVRNLLAVAGIKTISFYDADNDVMQSSVYQFGACVDHMLWTRDGRHIAFSSCETIFNVFDVEERNVVSHSLVAGGPELKGLRHIVCALAISPDCKMIAASMNVMDIDYVHSPTKTRLYSWDRTNGADRLVFFGEYLHHCYGSPASWSPKHPHMLAAVLEQKHKSLCFQNVFVMNRSNALIEDTYIRNMIWAGTGEQFAIATTKSYNETIIHFYNVYDWSDRTHHKFPVETRRLVLDLMCIRNRLDNLHEKSAPDAKAMPKLPLSLWLTIFERLMFVI